MLLTGRRKQVLIEPYKQLRFGIAFILLNFVFSALIFLVFGYYLWDVFSAITVYFQLDPTQEMIAGRKFMVPVTIGLGLLLLFIFSTLYVSARYTHQIYGPLVSIRRFLDEMLAAKNPAPIKLRTTDQLHDLVDRLNLLSGSLTGVQSSPSIKAVNEYLDQLLAGKEGGRLDLKEEDPLKPLSLKLNMLGQLLKSKR